MSFFISYFRIMLIFIFQYLSFYSQYHSLSSTITIFIWIIIIFLTFPFTRNILTILSQIIFNFLSILIFQILIMFPLFWWNYSIICQIHCNSPSIFTCNIWIMIIFFIWDFLFIKCLIHCFGKIFSFFSFLWIFILLVLPFFWNYDIIIPQIITNSMSFIILYI